MRYILALILMASVAGGQTATNNMITAVFDSCAVTSVFMVIDDYTFDGHGERFKGTVTFERDDGDIVLDGTNLVTTCLVTNVVEGKLVTGTQFISTPCDCEMEPGFGCTLAHGYMQDVTDPKIKTKTIIITERKTLTFTWDGKEEKIIMEKELSRTVEKWAKKETWEKSEQ